MESLQRCRCHGFPEHFRGFPYAVLEAMACGAAIVATDVGGVREALGDCGLLVPARTPRAMAQAISFLLNNATEREQLARKARTRVLKHFTEEQFLRSYESTYGELLWHRVPTILARQ